MSIWMAMLIGACIGVVLTTISSQRKNGGTARADHAGISISAE